MSTTASPGTTTRKQQYTAMVSVAPTAVISSPVCDTREDAQAYLDRLVTLNPDMFPTGDDGVVRAGWCIVEQQVDCVETPDGVVERIPDDSVVSQGIARVTVSADGAGVAVTFDEQPASFKVTDAWEFPLPSQLAGDASRSMDDVSAPAVTPTKVKQLRADDGSIKAPRPRKRNEGKSRERSAGRSISKDLGIG